MRFEAVAPEPSDGGLHQGALSQQSGSRQVLKGSVANRGAAAISVTGKRTGHITPPAIPGCGRYTVATHRSFPCAAVSGPELPAAGIVRRKRA